MSHRTTLLLAGLALALGAAEARASCSFNGLNGDWRANDGGTYRIVETGNRVSWVGKSAQNGKFWANRFRGTRNGDVIIGRWADYKGPMGAGSLTLRVRDVMNIRLTGSTGSGFGGTRWWRGCDDVILNPVNE